MDGVVFLTKIMPVGVVKVLFAKKNILNSVIGTKLTCVKVWSEKKKSTFSFEFDNE